MNNMMRVVICIVLHRDIPERAQVFIRAPSTLHGTWRLADSKRSLTLTVKRASCNKTDGGSRGREGKVSFSARSFTLVLFVFPVASARKLRSKQTQVRLPRSTGSASDASLVFLCFFFPYFVPLFFLIPSRSLIRLA